MGKRRSRRDPARGVSKRYLQSGEDVAAVARPSRLISAPRYLFTLGLYGLWRKRNTAVVTNRRLLLHKGIVHRTERSIPIDLVDEASYTRSGLASYAEVYVESRGGRRLIRVGPLSARAARGLTRAIQRET